MGRQIKDVITESLEEHLTQLNWKVKGVHDKCEHLDKSFIEVKQEIEQSLKRSFKDAEGSLIPDLGGLNPPFGSTEREKPILQLEKQCEKLQEEVETLRRMLDNVEPHLGSSMSQESTLRSGGNDGGRTDQGAVSSETQGN